MTLQDTRIDVKVKLAALWASVMFIYVYVDIVGFYKPGVVEDILNKKVGPLDISQTWAIGALGLMIIPSLMVFLSVALPARVNRMANLIVGAFFLFVSIVNVVGESWAYIYLGAAVEAVILVLILRHAWRWPVQGGAEPGSP